MVSRAGRDFPIRWREKAQTEGGGCRGSGGGTVARSTGPNSYMRRDEGSRPRDRPGNHRHHGSGLGPPRSGGRPRIFRASAALPEARMGRARRRRDLESDVTGRPVGPPEGLPDGTRSGCHRDHQPARDHGAVGQEDRKARSPGDRLAGSPDDPVLRRAGPEGDDRSDPEENRARNRPVLLGNEDPMAA